MAIVTAEKIFVDVNDEINFVVEKLLASDNDKVILVCPHNALIVSSQVSIKILVKQMLRSKKLGILVTEDQYGQRVAEAAGLVTADKVSQITGQMWEVAAARKEALQDSLEAVKKQLLTQRGILDNSNEVEVTPAPLSNSEPQTMLESNNPDKTETEEEEKVEVEELVTSSKPETKAEPEPEPELKGAIQRTRPEPKLVKMGSLKIMAGGDITTAVDTEKKSMNNIVSSKKNSEPEPGARRDANLSETSQFKGGFTGRDWTKYTSESQKNSILAKIPFINRDKPFREEKDPMKDKQRKRILVISLIALVAVILLGMYLVIFSWASVDVRINLLKTEVPIEQTINVDTTITEIDEETVTVPGIIIPVQDEDTEELAADEPYGIEVSGSRSGTATGEGARGDKASGLIEIWNKTEAAVVLAKGTKLTSISEGLVYVLDEKVELDAAESSGADDEVLDFGGTGQEWRVIAQKIGEDYNLDGDEVIDLSIEGYTTEQLIGKAFKEISGGTKEEFVSVSKQDFNQIRGDLRDDLIAQGLERLRNNVPDGYRLIEGTEVYVGTRAFAVPKIGEEAEEFTANLEGVMTAIAVKEEDLNKAIELLLLNSEEGEDEFQVTGLENAEFSEVTRSEDGNSASFLVSSSGNLQTVLTEDDVKQNLYNKNQEEAIAYLESIPALENYVYSYSPQFVPVFLRRMPGDSGRISVNIQ